MEIEIRLDCKQYHDIIKMKVYAYNIILCAVEDVDGDYNVIQCQWAQSTQGECDDLCSVLLPAVLNTCTKKLIFRNIYYVCILH